jgi:arylsulfatase A
MVEALSNSILVGTLVPCARRFAHTYTSGVRAVTVLSWWKSWAAVALWLVVCTSESAQAADERRSQTDRPNFVILLADDLGYGDLACYGNPDARTPSLDRMARQGVRFTDCYASFPVCSPSRAGLLTGRNATRYGIRDWIPRNSGIHLPRTETTIATVLRGAGYRTGHFGKWHLNSRTDGSEPTPLDHGFDDAWYTQNNAAPSHLNPTNFVRNTVPVGPLQGASALLVADEAVRWLDQAGADQSFLLNVWFHEPHEPIASATEFLQFHSTVPDPERRQFLANVSQLDAAVGRILDALEARGLRERTFVFFTSDNGPETLNRYRGAERSHGSPGQLRGMKLHLTEGGIRVPGIAWWPGRVPAGRVSSEPISNLDLFPTFSALAGTRPPTDRVLDGVNIWPAVIGQTLRRPEGLYWEYDRALGRPWTHALREGRSKVLGNEALTSFALYDLVDDPSEQRDHTIEKPALTQSLARRLVERSDQVKTTATPASHPDGIGKFFLGRQIAHVMGHEGAPWLERAEREEEEHPNLLHELLALQSGDVVADVGAGSGYHTRRMASAVGPAGRIFAVDVQPEMLEILSRQLVSEGITNVVPVLGSITDPGLPDASLDVVLMVDVYHELSQPYEMMTALCRALKPDGRMVLVEYRAEDPDVPIKRLHKMTEVQVRREMALHPLRWERTVSDRLPWQHYLEFRRDGLWLPRPMDKQEAGIGILK